MTVEPKEPEDAQVPDAQLDAAANPQQQYLELQFAQVTVGPLPSPVLLGQYDQVLPGLAETIVRMAEREQRHRHQMDKIEVSAPHELAKRGQWFGLSVVILMLGLAVNLAWLGHAVEAAIVAGVDLSVLVVAFIYGRRRDDDPPPA